MRVGISGTRGIPNAYGGFEQFAQYLALGLSQKGHETYVYNSSDHPYRDSRWNGVNIIHCRDWEEKIGTAGQFLYDYNCFRDASRRDFDILLQLGYTSSSVWHRFWPEKAVNIVNMDGLEWKRSKYNRLTQRFLRRSERWAAKYGDILVADSIGIRDHIRERYDREAVYIPYGADVPAGFDPQVPATWGLREGDYSIVIARMEPENNIEMVIRGWMASGKDHPLVIVGNTSNRYGRYLTQTYRHEGIRFFGAIYDQPMLNSLRHYSSLYFHGHSVGGTNPSLLEAMACGCAIAAHDNAFNKAVLGDEAYYFSSASDISNLVGKETGTSNTEELWGEKNEHKIRTLFNWDKIISMYEQLFLQALAGRQKIP